MALIDDDTAMAHCKADDADAKLVKLYLAAAEQAAIDYLDRGVYETEADLEAADDETGIVVNFSIKAAILLILGHLYENRGTVVTGTIATEIPFGAKALLLLHRLEPGA